jgi:hypothetical protein
MRTVLLASLALVGALVVTPSPAQAASCGGRVLADWRDGRIDSVYAIACYRDALANLPEDLRVYGTAQADIRHALTRRLAAITAAQRRDRAAATTTASTTSAAVTTTSAPAIKSATGTPAARRAQPTRSLSAVTSRSPRATRRVAAPVSARDAAGAMTPAGKVAVIGAMILVTAAVAVLTVRRLRRSA